MKIVSSPVGRLLFVGTTGVSRNRSALVRRLMHVHSIGKMTSMALVKPALPNLGGGITARHRATSSVLAMPTARTTFSFAGPRKLDDVIKTSLLENKTGSELAEIWCSYHETKVGVWSAKALPGRCCVKTLLSFLKFWEYMRSGPCNWDYDQRR